MTIVLTGTSGGLGSMVCENILSQKLLPPKSIRISAYSQKSVSPSVRDAGIEVRFGDLSDPSSLITSYEGADTLFLVSFPSVGEERFQLHKNAIDAAKRVGIKHILYTSLSFGGVEGKTSVAGVMQAHLKTTEYLQASGLKWTIIRMATYAHLWNNFAGFLNVDGSNNPFEVVIPSDGPNHWVNREDLGEATAKIIANSNQYVNQSISLVGPELLTISDIVALYAISSGRKITVKIQSVAEVIAYQTARGVLPAEQLPFLQNWVTWHQELASGGTSYLDPTLESLLGRKPKSVLDQNQSLFHSTNELDTKDFAGVD